MRICIPNWFEEECIFLKPSSFIDLTSSLFPVVFRISILRDVLNRIEGFIYSSFSEE